MTTVDDTPRRSYQEGCIAAHALDVVGERWALLVVRELMLGPRRFQALRAGLPGLSANILSRRLQELEAAGVVARAVLPPPAEVAVYTLTPAGEALWPVLAALCRWGAAMPGHDPRQFISPVALMLSMKAVVRPAPDLALTVGFRLGADLFTVRMQEGGYRVVRADSWAGDLRLAGAANAMAAVVYGPRPLAETAGALVEAEGDLARGQAFVDCFHLRAG